VQAGTLHARNKVAMPVQCGDRNLSTMTDFQFAQPLWLVAGVAFAIVLFVGFCFAERRSRRDLRRFVSGDLSAGLLSSVSQPLRWTKRMTYILAVIMVFASAARPQLGYEWREVKRKGIDVLFALDSSRSMLAEDISPNRLERAKLGMLDFVDRLEGDRVGLLPFAGSAFLLCPLTLDYEAFRHSLEAVDTEIIPRKGTDLASAIREAERIFVESGNNFKILVVITDGEDLQGEAFTAAQDAAEKGMVIHTVGIGSSSGELIPISTRGSSTDYLRDSQGELVRSKLDEAGLRAIAEAAGGIYAPFGQHAEGLQTIYEEKLSLLPKGEISQRMQQVPIERFQWPLGVAIVLLLIEFLLSDRRRESKRVRKTTLASFSGRSAAAVLLVSGLLILSLVESVYAGDPRSSYNAGIEAFEAGDLESAAASFESAISSSSMLGLQAQSYYNLGNTQFTAGAEMLAATKANTQAVIAEWEKSLTAFDGALSLAPDDIDARHNRDLVQRKIEELKQDEQQQDEQQQDEQQQDEQQQDEQQQRDSGEGAQKQSDGGETEDSEATENDADSSSKAKDSKSQGEEESVDGEGSETSAEEHSSKDDSASPVSEPSDGDINPPMQDDRGEDTQQESGSSGGPSDSEAMNSLQSAEPTKEMSGEEQGDASAVGVERGKPGEMSKEEARQLLKALENDEQRVLIVPAGSGHPRDPNNTTKGKDW